MDNEVQWGQEQSAQHWRTTGDHPAITFKSQALEEEGVQESQPQQKNQSAGLLDNGHVGAPLWDGDLVCNLARHQESPNEMPLGHCGCDFVEYALQC